MISPFSPYLVKEEGQVTGVHLLRVEGHECRTAQARTRLGAVDANALNLRQTLQTSDNMCELRVGRLGGTSR